ncbi:MAG: hypothetical protein LLF80_08055 [Porphyromonadaceae bacterium]|nr:hypothetical protein [Porphyromonadaceae bacterium]
MKSAEDFVRGYFKLFEEKKWDIIPDMYAEDGQVIGFGNKIMSLSETMKPVLERNKTEMTAETINIEWIQTKPTGSNTALVTTKYFDMTNRSGNIRITENIGNFLLEKNDDTWKIKMWINNPNFPVINSENIEAKYRVSNSPASNKFAASVSSSNGFECCMIEYFKKNGISPAELGKIVGIRYAATWDKSVGYEGLISNFAGFFPIISTYVEILERTDNTLKAKLLAPTIKKSWEITRDDVLNFVQNTWFEIADNMGSDCIVTDDGKYWTVVMNKK